MTKLSELIEKSLDKITDELQRKENKFKQFVLVAAPSFLGKLRDHMSKETQKLASFELAKNLSHLDAVEIRKHLPDRLPGL